MKVLDIWRCSKAVVGRRHDHIRIELLGLRVQGIGCQGLLDSLSQFEERPRINVGTWFWRLELACGARRHDDLQELQERAGSRGCRELLWSSRLSKMATKRANK